VNRCQAADVWEALLRVEDDDNEGRTGPAAWQPGTGRSGTSAN
jgi:hypothetical protein